MLYVRMFFKIKWELCWNKCCGVLVMNEPATSFELPMEAMVGHCREVHLFGCQDNVARPNKENRKDSKPHFNWERVTKMSEKDLDAIILETQKVLGKYIKKPPLTEKLLKKPPFRFLMDVFSNVSGWKSLTPIKRLKVEPHLWTVYQAKWHVWWIIHAGRADVREHNQSGG